MTKVNLDKIKKHSNRLLASVLIIVFFLGTPAFADERQDLQNQINQINAQLNSNLNQQKTLESEIAAIDSRIQLVQIQIAKTVIEINDLNTKINTLNNQIAQTEIDLKKQKILLGEYIRQMYIDGQASSVQLILTSNNFSDFVDKSQYLNTMQEKVKGAVGKIEILKEELDVKKNELEISKSNTLSLQAGQIAQRDAIASQQNYKNSLLENYKNTASDLNDQKDAIYNKMIQLSSSYGNTAYAGYSSYPWGNPPETPDSLDGLGYFTGECTSYVAWKRLKNGKPIPPAIGNGGEWDSGPARNSSGYPHDNIPKAGDVMVFPTWSIGGVGHVAYVESVNPNGTVNISQYNWAVLLPGEEPFSFQSWNGKWYGKYRYSEMTVNPWNYGAWFIH